LEFEWDEEKRQSTILKHGIDFVAAAIVLTDRYVKSSRMVGGEERIIGVGMFEDIYVAVVYTMRGNKVRLITARRARDNERRAYRKLFH
jgi:uncharacterized DUF497 family protein